MLYNRGIQTTAHFSLQPSPQTGQLAHSLDFPGLHNAARKPGTERVASEIMQTYSLMLDYKTFNQGLQVGISQTSHPSKLQKSKSGIPAVWGRKWDKSNWGGGGVIQ